MPRSVPHSPSTTSHTLWVMLLALLSGFALSQAFRTIATLVAQGLQQDFGISPSSLGAFAGLFGLSFGVVQLLMGIGMDVYGLRRTVLLASPFAALGATLSALAPSYGWLMLGQLLIGIGCSPAFLACTVFISRHFPSERFAFISGLSMGIGGLGLLFTGSPLAWVVDAWGWRAAFGVLALLCAASWLLIYHCVHEPTCTAAATLPRETWRQGLVGMVQLLRLPHTWGMLLLGMSCYAAFLSLRGLWIGPLLMDRYGFSLVHSGHVAFAISLVSLCSPAVFGKLDPGTDGRRAWLLTLSMAMAGLFVLLALWQHPAVTLGVALLMAALSGYGLLQYADVRASYPPQLTGRALSLFTMSMFLGLALMQWFTGVVAAWGSAWEFERYSAVCLTIAVWLASASLAYRCLPASPLLHPPPN